MSLRNYSSFWKTKLIGMLCGLLALGGPVTTLASLSRAVGVEATSAVERIARRTVKLADTMSGVRISKVDDGGKSALLATIQLNDHAKYTHFTLTNPHRLVVDVKNVGRMDVPNMTPVNSGNIERVRVGKYANAIRVVFDTRTEPLYSVRREADQLIVRIENGTAPDGKAAGPKTVAKAESKPTVTGVHLTVTPNKEEKGKADASKPEPKAAPTAAQPKSSATPVASPTVTPKTVPTPVPTPKPMAAPAVNPAPVVVKDPVKVPSTPAAAPVNAPPSTPVKPSATPAATPAVALPKPTVTTAAALPTPQPKQAAPANIPTPKSSVPVAPPAISAANNSTGQPAPIPTPRAAAASVETPRPRESAQTQQPRPASQPSRRGFNPNDYSRPDYVGEPIKLDLKAVDIREVLRFISDTYKVNFVVDKSVPSETLVTVSLEDVPWNQALEALLKSNRIAAKPEGNILRVMSVEAMAEEENQRRAAEMARQQATPLVTEMVRLNYARAAGGTSGSSGSSSPASGAGGLTSGAGAGLAGTTAQSGLDGVIRSRLSPRGTIQPDPRTNTLVITDIPENVAVIKGIIRQLDVPEPQVEIESRIVIANRNFARDLGVQLGAVVVNTGRGGIAAGGTLPNTPGPGGTIGGGTSGGSGSGSGSTGGTGFIGGIDPALRASGATSLLGLTTGLIGTAQISAVLSAQESKGNVKTISTPRITAQNNQTANIVNGVQIPVQTETNNTVTVTYVTAALRLEITPQITDTGNVVLKVVAENNSVNLAIATKAAPGINTQRAETTVLVPDGGTTIVGGINIDVESNSQQRTPGVSRVPGLGELFKRRTVSRSTDEILFFITPRIYRPTGISTN